MAKFQLIIDADDEDDLIAGVSRLAALLGGEGAADAPAAEAPKRGRPRKADASPATTASGAQAASPEASPGSASGQTATTAASPSDAAADLLGGAAATSAGMSKEALMVKIQEGMEKIGADNLKTALEAQGLPGRLSQIAEADYAKAAGIIDTAIAAAANNPLS